MTQANSTTNVNASHSAGTVTSPATISSASATGVGTTSGASTIIGFSHMTHTNLVVKSLSQAVSFYISAFGFTLISQDEHSATLTFCGQTYCLISESNIAEMLGYSALSPQTTGHSPAMTTTLICEDVHATWEQAINAGATPVKSPFTKSNGVVCATLIGPENYIWIITDSSNIFVS